jgi:Heavy metal binding domain
MSPTTAPSPTSGQVYLCPMHGDVRQASAGKCPQCGMDLLPQGTRFALLRHLSKSPIMLMIMAALMVAVMAAVMMMMR